MSVFTAYLNDNAQTPLDRFVVYMNASFIIPIYTTINAESSVKIGHVVADIFNGICQFCPVFAKIPPNFDTNLYFRNYIYFAL